MFSLSKVSSPSLASCQLRFPSILVYCRVKTHPQNPMPSQLHLNQRIDRARQETKNIYTSPLLQCACMQVKAQKANATCALDLSFFLGVCTLVVVERCQDGLFTLLISSPDQRALVIGGLSLVCLLTDKLSKGRDLILDKTYLKFFFTSSPLIIIEDTTQI